MRELVRPTDGRNGRVEKFEGVSESTGDDEEMIEMEEEGGGYCELSRLEGGGGGGVSVRLNDVSILAVRGRGGSGGVS